MSELIDKYFAGEMTCEEKKDLFDRIESDEALKKEFLRMQNVVALTKYSPARMIRRPAVKGNSILCNFFSVKD